MRKSKNTQTNGETNNLGSRQPGESIRSWRKRIKETNKYGDYGGELEPAVVTAEDTSSGNGQRRRARQLLQRNFEIEKILKDNTDATVDFRKYAQSIFDRNAQGGTSADSLNHAASLYRNILPEKTKQRLEEEWLKNLDEYYSLPVQHTVNKWDFSMVTPPHALNGLLMQGLKSKHLNDISAQLYGYVSRHNGYRANKNATGEAVITGSGADIIDLHDNVIRLTPQSEQSTALFNEFVEHKYPSVRLAKEYKTNSNMIIGDKNRFPARNVNIFGGIEDGKFRLDSLKNFGDNTTIIPARNIKSNMPKISKINISLPEETEDQYNEMRYFDLDKLHTHTVGQILQTLINKESINRDELFDYMNKANQFLKSREDVSQEQYEQIPLVKSDVQKIIQDNDFKRVYKFLFDIAAFGNAYGLPKSIVDQAHRYIRLADDEHSDNVWAAMPYFNTKDEVLAQMQRKGKSEKQYTFTDQDGNEHPISSYNASVLDGKTLLGNENGSYFIGRLQDISKPQLDSLNARLAKDPMWLMRTDLGSFDQYRLDSPSLSEYLTQYYEHPNPKDPNVYAVGTTTPNTLWETPSKNKLGGILKRIQ